MSTAVNELADNLASATIIDTNDAVAAQNGVNAAAVEDHRRLYIGNLAYATTEGELKDFFKIYTVESTSIPVNPRTERPVGYAFVDLATADEAQAAIAELSGKEIRERKVSVQLARKPESAEARDAAARGDTPGGGRRRPFGRGRGRFRGRGGRFRGSPRSDNGAAAEGSPLAEVTNGANSTAPAKDENDAKTRAPRVRKQRGPPADGIASKTKVMVANLPYDLEEDQLKEVFAAYEPVSVKIALRPISRFMIKKLEARNERRKGRGYGFVTLGSEELQQKAVNEMNGKEIEGREIVVKVAIDSPDKIDDHPDDEGAPAENKENGVEAATAPATAA